MTDTSVIAAEINRLKAESQALITENARQYDEMEALRAEVERLRSGISDAIENIDVGRQYRAQTELRFLLKDTDQ